MTNNEILRRLRYVFDFNDSKMIAIFALVNCEVTRAEVSDWLKQDDHESFVPCSDTQLALFLNGLIIDKRGRKEGAPPEPEAELNNNIIFRKLKIALNLQADEVVEILSRSGYNLSKHELSAFFRKVDHKHYRECKEQILRYFLQGLQITYRDSEE